MAYKILHIDWETRSCCDLKKHGLHAYALDPTTDILIASFSFDDSDIFIWKPSHGDCPREIAEHIQSGRTVVGHNVYFEVLINNCVAHPKYKFPTIQIEQTDDTMVRSYYQGLPGALAKAAFAAGIKAQKDMEGQRAMLRLCKPKNGPNEDCCLCAGTGWNSNRKGICDCVEWETDQKYYDILDAYGKQDVLVEKELDDRLVHLPEYEKKIWNLDFKINNRGVNLDLENAETAMLLVEKEKAALAKEMQKASKNKILSCQAVTQINDYLKNNGIVVETIGKAEVAKLLKMDLAPDVRRVLELRQEGAKNSTAKLKAMLGSVTEYNTKIRGCFQYYGAPSTGRFAGRRVQLQNLPRPTLAQDQIELIFNILGNSELKVDDKLSEIGFLFGPVMPALSSCLRGFLIASEGNRFIACDFSAIEARVLAWLAGEQRKLKIFRDGKDPYIFAAMDIYKIPIEDIDDQKRLIGKVADLSMGYQGGEKAFVAMGKNYQVYVKSSEAKMIKDAWRAAHPNIVHFWYSLEKIAMAAMSSPGTVFKSKTCDVAFRKVGSFLWCKLPSGRTICYPYPKIEMVETPWGAQKSAITYYGEEQGKWSKKVAYGGLFAENITQAVARDLLCEAMLDLDEAGYRIVMHTHDEAVADMPYGKGSGDEMRAIMCRDRPWTLGLPLDGKAWEGRRYRK